MDLSPITKQLKPDNCRPDGDRADRHSSFAQLPVLLRPTEFDDAADEEDQSAWAWQRVREAQQQRHAGGGPSADPRFSAHASWEARRNARLHAAAMGIGASTASAGAGAGADAAGAQPFADRGLSETGHYRAFAERYRAGAAASRGLPPAALVGWSLIFLGVYLYATSTSTVATRRGDQHLAPAAGGARRAGAAPAAASNA